jgi:hypothetical protein
MCFGDFDKIAEVTHPIIKAYADKIGADFVVINEQRISKNFFHYEKFQIFDLFRNYHRIIYMDTDILIRDDCPSLFEIVPENKIGLFNEGRFTDTVSIMQDACSKYGISLPKWDRQYYNTGVMVLSRIHRSVFKKPDMEADKFRSGNSFVYHFEQPYINLRVISGKHAVEEIDHSFNRMSLMDTLSGENRLSSHIVHYASASGVEDRLAIIKEDLKSWRASSPEYKYPINVHVSVGGGIGDQVCAEPVIRYMCEHVYKGENIRVKSDFPIFFKHLPVKIVTDVDIAKERVMYFMTETMPVPETPLWQFVSHALCHTVDFSSISVLRRTLPDKDKQIRLDVTLDDISSLVSTVGIRSLTDLVLVHPGRGWASKTFPRSYWQGVINGLADEGLPVAVIGKEMSKEQGLVNLDLPKNVLDLRNLLELNDLIALISQARVLLSNDSAPIHIAGAFNNWIILIPTCKHPDHVLPYRYGSKAYKTVVLYKRLLADCINSSPTMVNGQTIDSVIGDIMDYLPETEEVVKQAKNCYENN